MSFVVSARVRNLDGVKKYIDSIPRNVRGVAAKAAADYLVGNPARGLKHYPPPPPNSKYVRTYKLQRGWIADDTGAHTRVRNDVPYSPYVQGDKKQAWMHVGRWRVVSQVAKDNMKGMIRAAQAAVSKWLREHKK